MSKTTKENMDSIKSQEISDVVKNLEHYQVSKEDVEKNRRSPQQIHKTLEETRKVILENEDKETSYKRFKDFLYTFPGVSKSKIKELLKTISDFLDGIYPGFRSDLTYAFILLYLVYCATYDIETIRMNQVIQARYGEKVEPDSIQFKFYENLIKYVWSAGITSFAINTGLNFLLKKNPKLAVCLNTIVQAAWWLSKIDETFVNLLIQSGYSTFFEYPVRVYVFIFIFFRAVKTYFLDSKRGEKPKNSNQNERRSLTQESQKPKNSNIKKRNINTKKNTDRQKPKNTDRQKSKENTKIKSMNNNIRNIIRRNTSQQRRKQKRKISKLD